MIAQAIRKSLIDEVGQKKVKLYLLWFMIVGNFPAKCVLFFKILIFDIRNFRNVGATANITGSVIELKKISMQRSNIREKQSELRSTLVQTIYFKTTCLIIMKNYIRLEVDYKTYGKQIQVDSWSNYDVTTKTRNITIQWLFQNYLLDSDENLYMSFKEPQDLR